MGRQRVGNDNGVDRINVQNKQCWDKRQSLGNLLLQGWRNGKDVPLADTVLKQPARYNLNQKGMERKTPKKFSDKDRRTE